MKDEVAQRRGEAQILCGGWAGLAAHVDDIIILSDNLGNIVDVNKRAIEAYGYTLDEFPRLNFADLHAPGTAVTLEDIRQQSLHRSAFEAVHVRKDGSRFPVELGIQAVNMEGETYFHSLIRDVSKEKNVEEMLRDRERRLAEAQRLAKLGSWTWNMTTGDIQWSDELYRMFAYDLRQPLPSYEDYLSLYMSGSRVLFEVAVEQARYAGRENQFDLELVVVEHLPRWVTARFEPMRDRNEEIYGVRGTIQDISERKQQESLIKAASKEVADLYNNAPCGYHSLDKDGVVIAINSTELEWLGYRREEIVGKIYFPSLLSPGSRGTFYETFPRLKEQGWIRDIELELVRRDGSTFPVLVSATIIKDMDGNFLSTRSTVYDMTERKILEQERASHVQRLRELAHNMINMQEKERHKLSSELHDRSSANLAAIEMNFRNLANALPAPALQSVNDLLADTRALLEDTVASIREICTDLRPTLLDYAGLWPAIESYALQYSRRTGIEVRIQKPGRVSPFLPSVESNLFRIVQEALVNSAKHAAATWVQIKLENGNTTAVLSVSDNGCGFDPGNLGCGPNPPGMGLIMMRERAEFIGGDFSCESRPGGGMNIRLEIPIQVLAKK